MSASIHIPARPPLTLFAGRAPRSPLRLIALCYDKYVQRRVLAELDRRMLDDIGVTRRAAAQEAAKPFWR